MSEDLSPGQERALEAIRAHIERHGFAPTFREIGAVMGIGSTNGVSDHLRALVRKGRLEMPVRGSPRAMRIVGDPEIGTARAWSWPAISQRAAWQHLLSAVSKAVGPADIETVVAIGQLAENPSTIAEHGGCPATLASKWLAACGPALPAAGPVDVMGALRDIAHRGIVVLDGEGRVRPTAALMHAGNGHATHVPEWATGRVGFVRWSLRNLSGLRYVVRGAA